MHIAGGSLAIATWWIYLAGVFCAVFRIKVPYIPTPKEDEPSNAGRITLPNFIAAGVLILAACFGVYYDSSPPALLMAVLAVLNSISLLHISITSQQVTLLKLRRQLQQRGPGQVRGACSVRRSACAISVSQERGGKQKSPAPSGASSVCTARKLRFSSQQCK